MHTNYFRFVTVFHYILSLFYLFYVIFCIRVQNAKQLFLEISVCLRLYLYIILYWSCVVWDLCTQTFHRPHPNWLLILFSAFSNIQLFRYCRKDHNQTTIDIHHLLLLNLYVTICDVYFHIFQEIYPMIITIKV